MPGDDSAGAGCFSCVSFRTTGLGTAFTTGIGTTRAGMAAINAGAAVGAGAGALVATAGSLDDCGGATMVLGDDATGSACRHG